MSIRQYRPPFEFTVFPFMPSAEAATCSMLLWMAGLSESQGWDGVDALNKLVGGSRDRRLDEPTSARELVAAGLALHYVRPADLKRMERERFAYFEEVFGAWLPILQRLSFYGDDTQLNQHIDSAAKGRAASRQELAPYQDRVTLEYDRKPTTADVVQFLENGWLVQARIITEAYAEPVLVYGIEGSMLSVYNPLSPAGETLAPISTTDFGSVFFEPDGILAFRLP